MLKEEFKRAFSGWRFLLTCAVTFVGAILGILELGLPWGTLGNTAEYPFIHNAFDGFIYGACYWVLPILATVIAVLPFADSLISDRSSGYVSFILSRASFKKYIKSKFFANLLAGGLGLSIPLVIIYIIINIFYPRGFLPVPEPGEFWSGSISPYAALPGPMGNFYRVKPDLYVFFLIVLFFIFGAVYATLGLALSLFVHNRYVALATPFILSQIASFLFDVFGKSQLATISTLIPFVYGRTTWLSVFGELGVIFLISTICIFKFSSKKRIYE